MHFPCKMDLSANIDSRCMSEACTLRFVRHDLVVSMERSATVGVKSAVGYPTNCRHTVDESNVGAEFSNCRRSSIKGVSVAQIDFPPRRTKDSEKLSDGPPFRTSGGCSVARRRLNPRLVRQVDHIPPFTASYHRRRMRLQKSRRA